MSFKSNGAVVSDTTTPPKEDLKQDKGTNSARIKPDFNLDNLAAIDSHINEAANDNEGFPLHALPITLQEIVQETNECLNFPVDFTAASLLHAGSTAIGNTHATKWKWSESGCMFLVLVGNPGTIKTHPPNYAYAPFAEIDRRNYKGYKEAFRSFEITAATFDRKSGAEPPQKPVLQKHIVSDTTIEALINVLQNNPRGVCSHNDELAGWVNNMNRYNNGSDLQQWLSIWSNQAIVVDRKSSGAVRIDKPFVNVIGTIQPAIIDEMARDNKGKNGFLDRLLFVKPKGLKRQAWTTKTLDPMITGKWFGIIEKLLTLDFSIDAQGNELTNYLWFTPEAEKVLRAWQQRSIIDDEAFESETRDGISAKVETYAFRFSLILQLFKWACGEADKRCIEADTVESAIQIAEYFKQSALEVADYISGKNTLDRLPEIKKAVYKCLAKSFTKEDANTVWAEINSGYPEDRRLTARTLDNWLNDTALFIKVKHGWYSKLY